MSIKIKAYKNFSWDLHVKAGHKPLVAQIELTYRCPLHCKHCYTDCFNYKGFARDELSTSQIKKILAKCKADGTIWFCFTGGDPLMRRDFCELYLHARKLGFIITVFSSLVSMNDKILALFRAYPPFSIETTLNAATPSTYKKVTKTNLLDEHVRNIKKLLRENIPIRVKTLITKQNFHEIDKIKKLVESFGLAFRPSTMLQARLNGDTLPCTLRLEPKEATFVNKKYGFFDNEETGPNGEIEGLKKLIGKSRNKKLLKCAAGGHAFWISPLGKMLICENLGMINYDILKKGNSVKKGFHEITKKAHCLKFKTKSKCRECRHKLICKWCAGRAFLETGSLEKPIDYFCKLTEEALA
jgi:radical SAM protein with 4Fe4S-binding SPASM domain